jgi:hypothetical protein
MTFSENTFTLLSLASSARLLIVSKSCEGSCDVTNRPSSKLEKIRLALDLNVAHNLHMVLNRNGMVKSSRAHSMDPGTDRMEEILTDPRANVCSKRHIVLSQPLVAICNSYAEVDVSLRTEMLVDYGLKSRLKSIYHVDEQPCGLKQVD